MMPTTSYFSDNFFSAGVTDIFNEEKVSIGRLDLKSAFTSSVDVLDLDGTIICAGKFRTFSNRWVITEGEVENGELKHKMSFLKKRFEYTSSNRNVVRIESESFSKEYRLSDENGNRIAEFEKVSGLFQAPTFRLMNHSEQFTNAELITVVMGVHMINKRNQAASGSGHY